MSDDTPTPEQIEQYETVQRLTRAVSAQFHGQNIFVVQAALADVLAMVLAHEDEDSVEQLLDLFCRQVRSLLPVNRDILQTALRALSERELREGNCDDGTTSPAAPLPGGPP